MRVLIDACVLYPTVMREVVLGAAQAGAFKPLWSARILEEWARAARRLGPEGEEVARAEIASLATRWPGAVVEAAEDPALSLPDPGDIHVLSSAIAGGADFLMTLNIRDFPLRTLGRFGIGRAEPDGFLLGFLDDAAVDLAAVAETVRLRAEAVSGREQPMRRLLKRAGLPRLGKALG